MEFKTTLNAETARRYKQDGWWPDKTLLDYFDAAVERAPNATAIVAPGERRLTYRELADESLRIAAHFAALGIGKGDVVSLQLPNWAEFALVHLAATRLGAVTNPLLPIYRENELAYILKFARTSLAVIPGVYRNWDYPAMYERMWAELPDLKDIFVVGDARGRMRAFDELSRPSAAAVPPVRMEGDDVSALIFTSGTESKPKGVMHSHNTMMYGTLFMAQLLGLTERDVVWAPSPLGHGTGFLWGLRQGLTLGSKVVMQDIWDPEEALRLIEQERCSFTLSATPFAAMLVESPSAGKRDTSSLRIFASAGAPIPRALGNGAKEKLGTTLIGMWGMSECFVGSASAPDAPPEKLWETDGKAMPGGELAIFDEQRTRMLPPGEMGELATRGPHVALGYFNDPERTRDAFSADGWLFSNDLATIDADGYMRIVGRKKDIINRGGLKVSVREVEELLLQQGNIVSVAVVAVPDERLGEKGCAFVVPRNNVELTLPQLVRYLEDKGVAKYKLPEYLVVLPEFPMTPSGKIQKFQLRDDFVNGKCVPQRSAVS
jgi:non-ribosomal peptide synthetase component E (peptide arylation enzyme)